MECAVNISAPCFAFLLEPSYILIYPHRQKVVLPIMIIAKIDRYAQNIYDIGQRHSNVRKNRMSAPPYKGE